MADIDKDPRDGYEQMVRRRFAELDKGNFAVLDEMFDRGYRLNFPTATTPLSLDATKRLYQALYAAFPDLTHTITEQISARDKVVTRWFAQGTHRGTWMGVAGTGRTITLAGINIYTIRNGKLAESHVQWDLLGLLQQLDAVNVAPVDLGEATL
jgi:steroid delta-isomerase-like uncharacterized protein